MLFKFFDHRAPGDMGFLITAIAIYAACSPPVLSP
jgi:hypothetical protein